MAEKNRIDAGQINSVTLVVAEGTAFDDHVGRVGQGHADPSISGRLGLQDLDIDTIQLGDIETVLVVPGEGGAVPVGIDSDLEVARQAAHDESVLLVLGISIPVGIDKLGTQDRQGAVDRVGVVYRGYPDSVAGPVVVRVIVGRDDGVEKHIAGDVRENDPAILVSIDGRRGNRDIPVDDVLDDDSGDLARTRAGTVGVRE